MRAQWRAITYTVAYNANGGSETMMPSTHTYDAPQYLSSTNFSRTGYYFNGWNTEANGSGTPYTGGENVSNLSASDGAEVTLYAQWTAFAYTVAYYNSGDSGTMTPSTHTYNVPKNLAANTFTRTGFTFSGWNTEYNGSGTPYADGANVVNLSANDGATVTLYTQWTGVSYTVAYNANGGSGTMAPSAHTYGEGYYLPANTFTRTGYTFERWAVEIDGWGMRYLSDGEFAGSLSSIDGATVTLYAQWQPIYYTVVYNPNGGYGSMTSRTHTYDAPQNLRPSTFTRNSYTFGGWNTETDGSGTPYTDETSVVNLSSTSGATVTLYAQWTGVSYTVAYNPNGGTGTMSPSAHNYSVPKNLSPNAFTKTGYSFEKWTAASNGSGVSYADEAGVLNLSDTAGAEVPLYAQWTANSYTVAYNPNGGSGTMTSSAHTYDAAKNLNANAFTRTGYSFGGWNTAANGSGTPYAGGASVSNLSAANGAEVILYAQWWPDVSAINISVWVNEDGNILTSGDDVTISANGFAAAASFTTGVTSAYSGVQWYLNGNPIPGTEGTGQSITIHAADYESRSHYLEVIVYKDGVPYSTGIHFTVIN
jgi:uncharacterized repeat protein (TIGR02543 family)